MEASSHDTPSPEQVRILIVEDEPYIRDICLRVLRRQGYHITTAENGLVALERLAEASYDLVLTDIEMPKMSGMQLFRELRQRYPETDVIIFTAHATVETAREALKEGAFDYLQKPEIVTYLQDTIHRALEFRRVRLEKQRLSEMVALYDLSQTFTSTLDTATAVGEIVRLLWRRFALRSLSLSLLHPEDNQLELLAQRGELLNTPPGRRLPVTDHNEGNILAVHAELVGVGEATEPTHLACMVLRTNDRPVGLLRLARGADQPGFGSDDRRLLAICASQIAASLENIRLFQQLKEQNLQIISAFADMIDARDPYTRGHSEQVMRYAVRLAEMLGFSPQRIERMKYGALLHDIGKIGIRDYVLLKPGPLNDAEYTIMQQHPKIGAAILGQIKSLADVLPMIKLHHERVDGSGYPEGRYGDEIPIEARILAIADAYDAMTSHRSYRKARPPEEAINVLLKGRGVHWDAELVDVFVTMIVQEGPRLTLPQPRPAQAVAHGHRVPAEAGD